jgi:hypothetical protein
LGSLVSRIRIKRTENGWGKITSPAFGPGAEMFSVVLPFNICVFELEGLVHAGFELARKEREPTKDCVPDIWPVDQNMPIEVSPRDFSDPPFYALNAAVKLLRTVHVSR